MYRPPKNNYSFYGSPRATGERVAARWYKKWRKKSSKKRTGLWTAAVFSVLLYALVFSSPRAFEQNTLVVVPEGGSIRETAEILKEKKIIRSKNAFELVVRLTGRKTIAGKYSFQQRENVFSVGNRIARGDFRITPTKIRVMEGATVKDIAALLKEKIPEFDDAAFLAKAEHKEGYLFPDTYFILPGTSPETVVSMMERALEEELNKDHVKTAIDKFGKPLREVIIMASILEKEVPNTADRRVVAGILWKRIQIGMPLQVDAVFPYIIGKNSFQLTRQDLKMDSPYNTYVNKGLPAGPIANPSLDAILAAVTPIATDYLFYLSDNDGNTHYSATYDQHLRYKYTYLGT